jgi:hypothetical protein
MGIYNNIHNVDNDQYYYCSDRDCACHGPSYYDASRNYDFFRTDQHIASTRADHARTINNVDNYDHLDGA